MSYMTSPWSGARPAPGLDAELAATLARLAERALLGLLGLFRGGYFLLMWVVSAYEAAMMLGVPFCFPAIQAHLISEEAAQVLYLAAARGHVYLLPAVSWFLLYQGLPAWNARRDRRLAAG